VTGGDSAAGPAVMQLFRRILGYCIPSRCSYCRTPLDDFPVPYFCSSCWEELSPLPAPLCPRCGSPFGSPEALTASPDHLCRHCRKEPPDLDQALAAGMFEGQLREAIHVYKYRPLMALGAPLAEWMTRRIRMIEHLDLVIPVPLHRSRLRKRGFNQALLLAQGASAAFSVPLHYHNLVRTRPTRPQVELSGKDRTANVDGAFALLRGHEVKGKRVLLVDDVLTTGATMNECSRTLREAGAEAVVALTLARAVD
jgi:ComF family protein